MINYIYISFNAIIILKNIYFNEKSTVNSTVMKDKIETFNRSMSLYWISLNWKIN